MSEKLDPPGKPSLRDGSRKQEVPGIPRGLEVLLKKASVDPEFKALLLARREEAAATIGLTLAPGEVVLLRSPSAEQLEAIIARTTVPPEHRRAFLGHAAAAMLAALGVTHLAGKGELQAKLVPLPDPPKPPSSAKIEDHVQEVIAQRFQVERDKVKPQAVLLDLLKAGVGRQPDTFLPVVGAVARLSDEAHLQGLKRQLEKEYAIKLGGDDFFQKVKTVDDLVQAVQVSVKNTAQPKKPPEKK